MSAPGVIVLGGGLAGMAAAYELASNGKRVSIIEAASELGGLAGSFQRDGRSFPLGYHHILHRDRPLLYFLNKLGALQFVRWRSIKMLFHVGGNHYDLANPTDFLRYPLSIVDKAHFVRLMMRAFGKADWSDWHGRSAEELIDSWASPSVRRAMFEPLTRIKFGLPCSAVSAAWLGARLNHREGSAPLGYIPGRNWTEVLCSGLAHRLHRIGVNVVTGSRIVGVGTRDRKLSHVDLQNGDRLEGDVFVNTLPTEVFAGLVPEEASPGFREISYTALTSVICATRQPLPIDFYWMNLLGKEHSASGLFMLESLNPTLGTLGESYVNFVTHNQSRKDAFFSGQSEEALVAGYLADYRRIFGRALEPRWTKVNRVSMYSPVLVKSFANPPIASASFDNLFFAGNYRTFPSVVSTGTAMRSGLEAADAILGAGRSKMLADATTFSTPAMFLRFDTPLVRGTRPMDAEP